jgi:uncharacterized protein (TIGR01777 family)
VDVVVTGSHGLIGSALVPALEAAGHYARRLVRDGAGNDEALHWDPKRGTIEADRLEGVDAVVHLAGAGIGDRRWTDERKRTILHSRTEGTGLLARTLANLRRRPHVLVSASAVGYYGDRGDEELTEGSAPGDDFLARVCIEWEAATRPAAAAGIRVVTIRTGVVLAGHGGVLKRMLTPFRVGLGGRFGSGRQYMSWIALDDEVGAINHVLEDERLSGPVNLTAPSPVTNAEFTKTLGRVLHRPTVIPTPLPPLKLVYGSELVQHLLVEGQRVLPKRLDESGYRFGQATLEDALRATLDRH